MRFDELMTVDEAMGRAIAGLGSGERWLFALAGDDLAEARGLLGSVSLSAGYRLLHHKRLMELRDGASRGMVRVIPADSFVETNGVRGFSFEKIVSSPGIDVYVYDVLAPCLIPTGGNFVGVVPWPGGSDRRPM